MNKLLTLAFTILLWSCSSDRQYTTSGFTHNFEGILDTLLPNFAKLHDSIPQQARFSDAYKPFMHLHKKEREYQWLHYTETKEGFAYFMIFRREPSLKNDKFAAVCGRFKREAAGRIDQAAYEELFWTWKMKKEQLQHKGGILFKAMVETGSIEKYLPENSSEEWVEFPGNGVVYDRSSQTWRHTNEGVLK
jgi:hypothetical protein